MQEFAANAMTALHLNELTTYVPNLSIWLMYLLAVLGLLCCFFGYKLRNLWFAAVCLLFGCVVGNYLFSKGILDINFSITAGLLAAALFVFTYRLAPAEIGFCAALYLLVRWVGLELPPAILPAILVAVLAIFLDRWVITLSTAVLGSCALVNLLPRLTLPSGEALPFLSKMASTHQEYFLVLGILAVLGFLAQFGFGSSDPLIRFHRK